MNAPRGVRHICYSGEVDFTQSWLKIATFNGIIEHRLIKKRDIESEKNILTQQRSDLSRCVLYCSNYATCRYRRKEE